ncbi:unnamed protein product [Notodromas monacha]|uniref:ATP synthase subunit d, mitochondrial n=1 Tax=Notodromas monacha TaxID=399045 RepID=A0A7R9GDY7_9CRUS|nr:unnamed protein product [Notodromas monacha]CAG0917463.1 unnamed protein product [Notodromas monacha]
MATRRFTKSAVDWAALYERVPSNQKTNLAAFRNKSETYMRKLLAFPENPPKINWDMYRQSISVPAFVDAMKQQYESVKVPYPADKYTADVAAQEKEAEESTVKFIKDSNDRITIYQNELAIWDDMISLEEMTEEDFLDAFPQIAINPEKPSIWPHEPEYQPGYVDKEAADDDHH